MSFQRLSERVQGKSRPPESRWKVIPQSRTSGRKTPIPEFVMCSWHKHVAIVTTQKAYLSAQCSNPQRMCERPTKCTEILQCRILQENAIIGQSQQRRIAVVSTQASAQPLMSLSSRNLRPKMTGRHDEPSCRPAISDRVCRYVSR